MSLRVAYLSSVDMLPGASHPREDAFEYGLMMEALVPAFREQGAFIEGVAWTDPRVETFDIALIGTCWDYWDHHAAFLGRLEAIEAEIPLLNPAAVARWNSHKGYLRELEAAGVPSIPTLWLDAGQTLAGSFETLGTDEIVVKRQVGAGAHGQQRIRRGDPLPTLEAASMVQPFLQEIQTEGEISVVVIGGEISHGIRKLPAAGDYRIQSLYGGREEVVPLSATLRAVVLEVYQATEALAPGALSYARVDVLRAGGVFRVMEVELVEPYLYPMQGPELGQRVALHVLEQAG